MKKTFTIKDAYTTDKQYLDEIAKTEKIPQAEAFALIVAKAKTSENSKESIEKLGLLEIELANTKKLLETSERQLDERDKLIEELKNQEPKTIQIEKEVIKEIEKPVQLTGSQFICELDEQTALLARKVRKFALQDGHVNSTEPHLYANQLVNTAVKNFLDRKYDHLK